MYVEAVPTHMTRVKTSSGASFLVSRSCFSQRPMSHNNAFDSSLMRLQY